MTERKKILLAGLGFGDEGKGTISDWLTSVYDIGSIWRYNGGCQAAHHVVASNGVRHCFSQFGAGSLNKPVHTYLSRFMAINPISLLREKNILRGHCSLAMRDFTVPEPLLDAEALITTPYHSMINQIRELSRGPSRFGSCGLGVGETIKDGETFPEALRIKDMLDGATLRAKLKFLQALKLDQAEQLLDGDSLSEEMASLLNKISSKDYFEEIFSWYLELPKVPLTKIISKRWQLGCSFPLQKDIIFEGAQGVLLDRNYGFYPYIAKSDATFNNAEELIKELGLKGEVVKIGVLRAYSTRHGAGPFVTFDPELTVSIPEQDNQENEWQGAFKIGWFDLIATRYALSIVGKVNIALTNIDRLLDLPEVKICRAYRYHGDDTSSTIDKFFEWETDGNLFPIITGIKLPSEKDLSSRQQITQILKDCHAIYDTIKVNRKTFIEDYTRLLENALGIRINIISTGPCASDKQIISPLT